MADKIRARAAVVIAAATVSLAVGNAPLGAQPGEPPDLPMSISPTSGPIGTVIVISGEECFAPDGSGGHHVWLAGVEDQGDYMPLETTTPVDADGTWEYRFTLAADPPSIETLGIYGTCNDTEHTVSGHYPTVMFDVVHPPSTDPPPTTPATGPEAPAPDTGAPGPPATTPRAPTASPVLDQPTYTG